MAMYVTMFTSPNEYEKYKTGRVAWGISEEARKEYPYMRMEISVHSSEVIGIELKTIELDSVYNERREFLSYEIRRLKKLGD